MASARRATGAPKQRTQMRIDVLDGAAKALDGATIDITPTSGGAQHGKTAKQQGWTSRPIATGDCQFTVMHAGFGPPSPPTTDPAGLSTPTEGPLTEMVTIPERPPHTTVVSVTLEQALPRAVVTVVDGFGLPVIGAQVTIGDQTGMTDLNGVFTSPYLPMGFPPITVAKQGYRGPFLYWFPGRDANAAVAFADLDQPKDVPVEVKLENIWGRVRSHNITVGGKNFVDWFNASFRPSHSHLHAMPAAFNDVFDSFVPKAWPNPLSLEEFIAILLVIEHETGGTFESVIEKYNVPELKYFFEPSAAARKQSYNHGLNERAGERLARLGILDKQADAALVAAWDAQQPYPGPSAKVSDAVIRECDFYKYRGRGLIQVTWHDNYATKPFKKALVEQGFGSMDMTVKQVLDACPVADMDRLVRTVPAVYNALVSGWLSPRQNAFLSVNFLNWEAFRQAVNTGPGYAHYAADCTALRDAMIAAGPSLQ